MNFFRSILAFVKKKERAKSKNLFFDESIDALFTFLLSRIGTSTGSNAATVHINNYLSLRGAERREKLAESYLFAEKYLTDIDTNFNLSKEELRSLVKVQYAKLLSIPKFALIFKEEDEQEFELCKTYLLEVLSGLTDLLGEAGSHQIQELKKYVDDIPNAFPRKNPLNDVTFNPSGFNDWVHFVRKLSFFTFNVLSEKLGEEATLKRYDKAYRTLANHYINLDSFQVIISVLPEKLMDEDRVSTLTKHQIEKLLLKKADHFERLTKDLSEKNAELQETQKQLIAAKEIAESATKAKAMFLANMSHEIRTPMNAVIGMTEILKETNPSKEQLTFIETIHKSGYDLVHIINDILDYSKIESGKMELEVQPINLHELVSETANLLVLKAEEKNIELIYYIDEEIPPILHADPTRLKQILVNLVNNAIKFTSIGEVVIEITLEKKLASEAVINFKVIDTGIGIPENKINHIFDSFSQVDASTTRNYGGTGLGLTITKSLVELMSGEVSVTSTMGEGSTFKFVVGLPYTASTSKSPRHSSIFKNKTLLFADQNASHRKYLGKKLQSLGFNVSAFQTIEELIANIKTVPIVDLILAEDFLLGNMTDSVKEGFEQLLKTGQIPLIKMLPFGKVPDLEKVNSLSIKRPLKRENLISVLTTALEGSSKKSPKSSTTKTHEPKNISVLLAEDNKTNQLVAKGLLKSIGYQIEIVDNGVDVISKLDEKHYDLILMDVQMPVLDGLEATQKIRDLEFKPGQPIIIAMTANAMEEDRDRCIEAGMNDYLSKPVKRDEIIEKIEKWFPDN